MFVQTEHFVLFTNKLLLTDEVANWTESDSSCITNHK